MLKFQARLTLVTLLGFALLAGLSQAQTAHIVINEIQISGASAKDEFIELYNPTNSDVSLDDWRLSKKTASGNEYNLLTSLPVTSLPAGGYLVISHQEYTGPTDLNYSTSQSIAKDNTLILYSDAGTTVVDLIGWGAATIYEGAGSANNPESNQSLVRSGDTDDNLTDFNLSNNPTPGQTNDSNQNFEPVPLLPEGETTNQESENNLSESPASEAESTEPEPEPTPFEDIAEPTIPSYPTAGKVIINELLPNPEGSDTAGEWIELKNIDSQTIDITDWILSDSSRDYILPETTLIGPGAVLTISRANSKIALNNSGTEIISLLDSQRYTQDQTSYFGPAPENESWAHKNNKWQWSASPTKGYENIVTQKTSFSVPEDTGTSADKQKPENTKTNNNAEPTTNYDYSQLIINELLPNPEGSDEAGEWIELYNKGSEAIDLTGLKIGDVSKVYEIETGILEAEDYYILNRTESKIALNNNGDELKLWSPDGALIILTRYFTGAAEGEAYALGQDKLWDWTLEPTPGEANIFPQVLGSRDDNGNGTTPASSHRTLNKPAFLNTGQILLAEVRDYKVGDAITTTGIVAVEPGLLAKTYFYIADSSAGIKIYSAKQRWPDNLKTGDLIKVSGKLSESQNELRINVGTTGRIELIGQADDELTAQEATLEEIDEPLEGSLVSLSGEIVSIKSSNIYIADANSEARVYLASNTDLSPSAWQVGDEITVQGLVSETKTGYRILPRYPEDITLAKDTAVAGAADEQIFISDKSSSQNLVRYFIGGGIVVLIIGFLLLNRKFNWVNIFSDKNKTPVND